MIFKTSIKKAIYIWLKRNVRYRMGGEKYLEQLEDVNSLCSERSEWLIGSMDFYADSVVKELGEKNGTVGI